MGLGESEGGVFFLHFADEAVEREGRRGGGKGKSQSRVARVQREVP
jgi:hypothetical protein